jgi:hypothetical protein
VPGQYVAQLQLSMLSDDGKSMTAQTWFVCPSSVPEFTAMFGPAASTTLIDLSEDARLAMLDLVTVIAARSVTL